MVLEFKKDREKGFRCFKDVGLRECRVIAGKLEVTLLCIARVTSSSPRRVVAYITPLESTPHLHTLNNRSSLRLCSGVERVSLEYRHDEPKTSVDTACFL